LFGLRVALDSEPLDDWDKQEGAKKMEKTYRLALAQLAIADGDKEANLKKMEQAIKEASDQLADIVIFPELNLTGLVSKEQMKKLAEGREGESFRRIQQMIGIYHVSLVYSFPEYVSEEELYITTCFMSKEGEAVAYYRKTHLFTDEKEIFTAGNEWITVSVESFRAGFLTCYDIEFPEPARALALKGVNLLIVNSANMEPYDYIHRLFICARALENQLFVAYCNRIGSNEKYQYCGESAVIGPDGKIIAEFEKDAERVLMIDISADNCKKSQSEFYYLADCRPELYE
jgi:predicted amidohydrolase